MYTQVLVHCRAEYAYPGQPLRFIWADREYYIDQVLQAWIEPGLDCFLVTAEDGIFELAYSRTTDSWVLRQFAPLP